jgi:hypothetical protein
MDNNSNILVLISKYTPKDLARRKPINCQVMRLFALHTTQLHKHFLKQAFFEGGCTFYFFVNG